MTLCITGVEKYLVSPAVCVRRAVHLLFTAAPSEQMEEPTHSVKQAQQTYSLDSSISYFSVFLPTVKFKVHFKNTNFLFFLHFYSDYFQGITF